MVLVTGNDVKTVKLAAKQTVHLKIIIFYLNLKQENQTKILASFETPTRPQPVEQHGSAISGISGSLQEAK